MKKKNQSVDGIILKRPSNHQTREVIFDVKKNSTRKEEVKFQENDDDLIKSGLVRDIGTAKKPFNYSQGDNDLPKESTDDDQGGLSVKKELKNKSNFFKRRRLARQQKKIDKRSKSKLWRIIKKIITVIILVSMLFVGYNGFKLFLASNSMFSGNIFQAFQAEPLKTDSNGRSNFLILGTSEDDPGHEGANLTDTMIVVSVDQTKKNAYIFSVPRDLHVQYGEACFAGYSGKINSYFYCSNDGETDADEQDRLSKTQKLVGDIFGMDIQYGVHVNYTVVVQAVDAVGGINVDIQGSNGEKGIMDRHFDYQCDYKCYLVKYDNGVHHLDGQQALNLARVRGDEGSDSYGLSRSNFDREINQQKIIMALKDKAVDTGTLTNFNKVSKLIDALGNNLRTNIKTNEIRTLMDVAKDIDSADIHSLDFVADFIMDGSGNSVAGLYEYSDIQAYIKKNLSNNPIEREAAPIVVLNGSGKEGLGKTKADSLTAGGYNVSIIDNAPDGDYEPVEIYQIGDGNSGTAAKLTKLYNVTIKDTDPPIAVNDDIKFVIIFGDTTQPAAAKQ